MNAEIRMHVAERLRQERARLGLGQVELAKIGGISTRTQAAWEKGEQSPNADYLCAAAQAGLDVLFVVTGERAQVALSPDSLSSDEVSLLGKYRLLSDKTKAVLKDLTLLLASKG